MTHLNGPETPSQRGNLKWQCPCTATFGDFIPKFLTVSDSCSILTVCCRVKTNSCIIKPIKMIADALVLKTKLRESQIVTFAAHPLGVQQIFLTVICTP